MVMMISSRELPSRAAVGVCLHGDLDGGAAAELRGCLTALLDRHRPSRLTLDLTDVTFIDCSGARTLSWLDLHMRRQGGTLAITRPSRPVLRLLRLLRFDGRLRIDERAGEDGGLPENWRIIRLRSFRPDHAPSAN
ncbi:STAS domain-containing protein [Sphaerisporangium sp. TRM90804]|uniref:STAS domain-containing protein n=1 Tax=Sphaerisporangium sp. TRM90804 TaxID=3031113 RepID=UPI0024474D87|nr:STAS domain-containing protein [Sphaerisporangium sp. TRM90804]MDH2429399.1 STAS domain-containing protein [Sphaerisporangium sp. TRM90804]